MEIFAGGEMTKYEFEIKVIKTSIKITRNLCDPGADKRSKFKRMKKQDWVYFCIHQLIEESKHLESE